MDAVHHEYLRDPDDTAPDFPQEMRERLEVIDQAPWTPDMEAAGLVVVYAGHFRSTEVIEQCEDVGGGAGRIRCWECGGTGTFELPKAAIVCPVCRGTGKQLVSI